MTYTFIYEESLMRTIHLEANNFADAYRMLIDKIDNEEIVLDSSDFIGAEIRYPVESNNVRLSRWGGNERIDTEGLEITLDIW